MKFSGRPAPSRGQKDGLDMFCVLSRRRSAHGHRGWLLAVALTAAWIASPSHAAKDESVHLSGDELKKLDTFEGHALNKAEKAFVGGNYRQADALYESFLLEYPRSKVTSYVIFRRGRCLHLDGKRYKAIKQYQEVLDYFPNDVKYAAAALYYQGQCHLQNGDEKDAMKTWAKMAADKDYRKVPLAAWAINRLADHLRENEQYSKAVPYYRQVAVDFRKDNGKASQYAIEKVAYYYIRVVPDEPKLREFYEQVQTFHDRPRTIKGETIASEEYWDQIRHRIHRWDRFDDDQDDRQKRFYRYWANAMDPVAEKHFAEDDAFLLDVAWMHLRHEGSESNWIKRVDEIFAANQTEGDFGRIVRWIGVYAGHKAKAMEYYRKLDFAKMSNGEIIRLMEIIYEKIKDPEMGANTFDKLRIGELKEDEKIGLAHYFKRKDLKLSEQLCASLKDDQRAKYELLKCYRDAREYEKGIKLATVVANIPDYAQDGLWMKAEMLQATGKYADAIGCYQQADNPPDNLWEIARCYEALKKWDQAIAQLGEIEGFFKNVSSRAALEIAKVYGRKAGRDRKNTDYVKSLRRVTMKYPKSTESSHAHQELERMGIRTGGGVDAE